MKSIIIISERNNSMTKLIHLLGIALFLISCEGGTTFTKTIHNNSSYTITVSLYSILNGTSISTIPSLAYEEFYWDDQERRFVDDSYSCTQEFDSLIVSVSKDKTLLKDIMNPNNWVKNSSGGRMSREDCVFIISNDDIN